MKTLVVGAYLDPELLARYNAMSSVAAQIPVSAIKYSKFISDGFKNTLNKNAQSIFLPTIGTYPHCKTLSWTLGRYKGDKYIKFINIFLIKQITISFYLFFQICLWIWQNRKSERVLVFTFLYAPFQVPASFLRFLGLVRVVAFVPDLPQFEFSYTEEASALKRWFIPLYIKIANKLTSNSDYFVYITKYMAGFYPKKPYSIIEGFSDTKDAAFNDVECIKKNAIFYSGALYEKFGIKTLIEAFCELKSDFELWLAGAGDMNDYIRDISTENPDIKFFGVLPNNEVVRLQRQAKLLVNPRFSNHEFTKYSFPSKIMEYLSSGTPVLTTKLQGIPAEYDQILFYFEREDKAGFLAALQKCTSLDDVELNERGKMGKDFVTENKNFKVLIRNLVDQISNTL